MTKQRPEADYHPSVSKEDLRLLRRTIKVEDLPSYIEKLKELESK